MQLGSATIFHLYNISLQRPCPVLIRFRLHHNLRGSENSLDLAECLSKLKMSHLRSQFNHFSFQTSLGSKSVAFNDLAVTTAGCLDFKRCMAGMAKSFFSGIGSPFSTLRNSLSRLNCRLMFGGMMLHKTGSHTVGVE